MGAEIRTSLVPSAARIQGQEHIFLPDRELCHDFVYLPTFELSKACTLALSSDRVKKERLTNPSAPTQTSGDEETGLT